MERLFQRDIFLKTYCTYGVGGPARFFYEPRNPGELKNALVWAKKTGTPVFILGKGSNLLVSDKGFDGLVLRTSAHLTRTRFENVYAEAESGVSLDAFIETCAARGLAGLERLYDIPGTVGGAVVMNAGAFDAGIGDGMVEAVSLDAQGAEHCRPKNELAFAYRNSLYRTNGETLVSARFRFQSGDPAELKGKLAETRRRRDEKQPPDRNKSCGSVFKRPVGGYAGRLIEQAGLKGVRVGGAKVSEKHANFIINDRGASAADIRRLIDMVRERVRAASGVWLEPEVIFLGEF